MLRNVASCGMSAKAFWSRPGIGSTTNLDGIREFSNRNGATLWDQWGLGLMCRKIGSLWTCGSKHEKTESKPFGWTEWWLNTLVSKQGCFVIGISWEQLPSKGSDSQNMFWRQLKHTKYWNLKPETLGFYNFSEWWNSMDKTTSSPQKDAHCSHLGDRWPFCARDWGVGHREIPAGCFHGQLRTLVWNWGQWKPS